ncbi:MAG: hypothetical protein H7325_07390 [Pedobacter sp.]|nr:hypothetical protein [Pedobacter sp.]
MKKVYLLVALFSIVICLGKANAQGKEGTFTGAKASLKSYHALYVINSNDEKKIAGTLRNMRNALDDPRLKGKFRKIH